MLILTRKSGESIIIDGKIDGKIEIKITGISDEKIKIGIDAPAEMKVYRKELYDTLEENKSAAGTVAAAVLRDISRKME
ncbi:MAG: carbon storage regulator [Subdoligranulum sp.]|nr:carbon storage regulator [Subdoligranulum sp.]MBD5101343.1 carbon storage regulator [Subdoligranulum sp.]